MEVWRLAIERSEGVKQLGDLGGAVSPPNRVQGQRPCGGQGRSRGNFLAI